MNPSANDKVVAFRVANVAKLAFSPPAKLWMIGIGRSDRHHLGLLLC